MHCPSMMSNRRINSSKCSLSAKDPSIVGKWSALELYPYLGYTQWCRFEGAIESAKESCKSASQPVEEQFADVRKMIFLGIGGKKDVEDIFLTRYDCYLVAMKWLE